MKANPTSNALLIQALEHARDIQPMYEARLANLPRARALNWVKVGGWWAGFMAVLYLAGWSVGWIFRGFFPAPLIGA